MKVIIALFIGIGALFGLNKVGDPPPEMLNPPISIQVPIDLPDCTDVVCLDCPPGSEPIYSTHECCPSCGPPIQ